MIKSIPAYIVFGIIGLIAFYAGFTGKRILFVTDQRSAVIVLMIVGFVMCSMGTLGVFLAKAPTHPLTIAGYLLGSLALITGIIQIFRFRVPFLGDPGTALKVMVVIIILKFVIARMSFLLPGK